MRSYLLRSFDFQVRLGILSFLAFLFILIGHVSAVFADDLVAVTNNGDWHDQKTWSPEKIPGPNDTVKIPSGIRVSIGGTGSAKKLTVEGNLVKKAKFEAEVIAEEDIFIDVTGSVINLKSVRAKHLLLVNGAVLQSPVTGTVLIGEEGVTIQGTVANSSLGKGDGAPTKIRSAKGNVSVVSGTVTGSPGSDGGKGGDVEIVAEKRTIIATSATVTGGKGGAKGDGGKVLIVSLSDNVSVQFASQVTGGGGGNNGGDVETVAAILIEVVDGSQVNGGSGGKEKGSVNFKGKVVKGENVKIDPGNIEIFAIEEVKLTNLDTASIAAQGGSVTVVTCPGGVVDLRGNPVTPIIVAGESIIIETDTLLLDDGVDISSLTSPTADVHPTIPTSQTDANGNGVNYDCEEEDSFPRSEAEVEITGPFGSDTVTLRGPTTVLVGIVNPQDNSDECPSPGLPDVPNGKEEVQTEIVQMELTGTSNLLGPIKLRLRDPSKSPFKRSTGQIEEGVDINPGILDLPPFDPTAGPACSFFDVFFEIETEIIPPPLGDETVVTGNVFHNEEPKRMQATITNKPPAEGETYESSNEVELFDEEGNPTGIIIRRVSHTPNPSVPLPPPIPALTPLGTIAMALLITLYGIRGLGRR